MASNPWHVRAAPFFVYMIGILLGQLVYTGAFGLPELPVLIPVVYTAQVGIVVFLLVRYRRLLPELNARFHWLALPTGIGLLYAWVYLGYATNWLSYQAQDVPVLGDVMAALVSVDPADPLNKASEHELLSGKTTLGDAWFWTTMSLRLLGMSLVVPFFEELWVRSAVLRGTFSAARTKTAILQLASDLPIIGEPMFTLQLEQTPVGQVSFFAIFMSTLVFMLAHGRRDYLGCIACGLVWCWLVWFTNRPRKGETWEDQPVGGRVGLGPIIWSHGITNAALWAWTLYYGDWQFL